jgi:hypothetical protein
VIYLPLSALSGHDAVTQVSYVGGVEKAMVVQENRRGVRYSRERATTKRPSFLGLTP